MLYKTSKQQIRTFLLLFILTLFISACQEKQLKNREVRYMVDSVGFATQSFQMDSIMSRIESGFQNEIDSLLSDFKTLGPAPWKTVICPHDDYAYAGYLYPVALNNVKAKTIVIFGVAHKAKSFNLEDKLVFDSFRRWAAPYGEIPVSDIREELFKKLDQESYIIHDSMQMVEHSVEAVLPFLQYQNPDIEIVSILIPYMKFERMDRLAKELSAALAEIITNRNLSWGNDIAFLISNDAVHYGDEDWGGKSFAFYGADTVGYIDAMIHEKMVIQTISGDISKEKIKSFCDFTVSEEDHKAYKWTWCGRYSVPLGLLTSYHLGKLYGDNPISGDFLGYATSIGHKRLYVEDLGMGVTAPANIRHWVGYVAIGYQ